MKPVPGAEVARLAVLRFLQDHGPASFATLCERLNLSRARISAALTRLDAEGLIEAPWNEWRVTR
jgi:DNA-binding MarR family transcriptional regulator